jgi:hypothetical protein
MAVKVKELKDDAVVDIKVNKNYYLMMKATLFYLFLQKTDDQEKNDSIKKIMEGKLEELNDWERAFHTITLFLAEVEKQAQAANLYDEKELLEPGDEGYVAPSPE